MAFPRIMAAVLTKGVFMNMFKSQPSQYTSVNAQLGLSRFMGQVYLWMMMGLGISALTAFFIDTNPVLLNVITSSPWIFNGLLIVQLGMVLALSFLLNRISAPVAMFIYLTYAALTGVTFAVILMLYTQHAIVLAFAATAGSFFALSMYSFATKRDLSPIGSFCYMGLWGMIIVGLLAFFLPALRTQTMNLTYAAIGVLVFSGLTAYDTQRIKNMYLNGLADKRDVAVISGALMLYLDFINLFLSLLRLFGGGKR